MNQLRPRSRARRRITGAIVVVLLAGGATATVLAIRHRRHTATTQAASTFSTTTVQTGSLATTAKISGVVQLSSTTTVLERIAGQTSSATTTPTAASSATGGGASTSRQPTAAVSAAIERLTPTAAGTGAGTAADCATTSDPNAPTTSATTTATLPPTTTTIPPTTIPATTTTIPAPAGTDGVPTGTDQVPSIGVAPDGPLQPAEPVPTTPGPTPGPTPASAPTAPTTPAGGSECATAGTGGSRTGGSGRSSGGSGRSSGGSGSSASTARVTQTITSITTAGTAIGLGDIMYTVDSAPVVALSGPLPAWRTMSTSSTNGADIAQLEASLKSLGYDPQNKVTVDDHFDSATKAMVERWQTGLGEKATGSVTLGSVVFLPSPADVASVTAQVGSKVGDGDTVLTLAASAQQIVIDVPDGDEALVTPGLSVGIGSSTGTVTLLRSVDTSGTVTVEAVIAPAAPIDGAGNGASVNVTLTLPGQANVLTVSAQALASKLDGSYAVEVRHADGTTAWVPVALLGISGDKVGIRPVDPNALAAGASVLVPA